VVKKNLFRTYAVTCEKRRSGNNYSIVQMVVSRRIKSVAGQERKREKLVSKAAGGCKEGTGDVYLGET